jgi:hypothetical protein
VCGQHTVNTRQVQKVKWTRCCIPKESGGLGIPNLVKFGRALRLIWLWHQWVSTDKPGLALKHLTTMRINCGENSKQIVG